jgi:hypothetical protein
LAISLIISDLAQTKRGGQECLPLFIYKNNPILFWNIQNDVVDL